MDQERWKRVNNIFHAALEISPIERNAFVLIASDGDLDIQIEVELLLEADQHAGTYLERSLLATNELSNSRPPLNPGEVLCSRFRILRAVGEGGMGHVFEAYDIELAVHVAIKIIRPEIASNVEALSRFRQEVRLARRITHPNVCRTFDLDRESRVVDQISDTKQEVVFLTMEFLEGETLDSRIKRTGALQLREAHILAKQIADALHAAHTLGVVHRDIKPANIMLVPSESAPDPGFRAVITDFGLARLDTALPQVDRSIFSHSGKPIGTLAYMAPEQLEGAAVSTATDIYAFGLTLFEMVTGARAFPSDNLLGSIAHRLTGTPPSLREIIPTLPVPWCQAIEGCLFLKPADRFRSAADVTSILDGARIDFSHAIKSRLVRRLPLASWPPRRRLYAAATIFVAAMALFLCGYRLYRTSGNSKVDTGALVYLTQVKNQTGERSIDNVTELLQAGLSQSAQINLLDQSRVGDTLQLMTKAPDTVIDSPIAREIAMRNGAVRVIFATVTNYADTYQLNIEIQQPDAGSPTRYRDHWQKSFAWQSSSRSTSIPQELTGTLRKASDWVRTQAGESKNDIATLDTPPGDVTTNSWDALAEYKNARHFSTRGEPASAVLALQHAVIIDPQFALAYGLLGDTLASLHRTSEAYEAYRNALSVKHEFRLTPRERSRIKGMYAIDSGDFEAAVGAFRDYTTYYESDPAGWAYSSYPLEMLGRTDEAILALRRAEKLDPHSSFPITELITCFLSVGHYEEAKEWTVRLRSEGYTPWALVREGELHFLKGEYGQAAASFHSAGDADSSYRESGNALLARLEAEQGQVSAALLFLNRDIDQALARGDKSALAESLLDRAYLRGKHGEVEASVADIDQAIGLAPSVQNLLKASSVLGTANFATHAAHAAEISRALKKLETQLPSSGSSTIFEIARLRIHGERLLAQNHWQQAVYAFNEASQLDAPVSTNEYLARALMTAADREAGSDARKDLQEKALKAYETVVLRPGFVWSRPTDFPPGFYADQLSTYVQLSTQTNSADRIPKSTLSAFRRLRPQ